MEDFNLDNILIDEKPFEKILVYKISYKPLIGAKPLYIRFNKEDEFIRVYGGARYLVLFGVGKQDAIYNMIRYFIGVKNGINYFFHSCAKVKVNSYVSSTLEKECNNTH